VKRLGIRAGVRRLFRLPLRAPDIVRADADAELDSLLDERIAYLVDRGMTPAAARAEALERLGGVIDDTRNELQHSAQRRERRMQIRETLDDLLQDLRYAARGLARRPGFTAVAVLTLAIGIGATTAIFSAVHTLILRPLPFKDPGRLMKVSLTMPPIGTMPAMIDLVWSYPKFLAFRDQQRVFDDVTLTSGGRQFNVTGGEVERIGGEEVDTRYLPTLGVEVKRGANFPAEEDAHGGAPKLALISDGLWQRRFGADPAIVGKAIELDQESFQIVGVTPPGFRGVSGEADVLVPITVRPADDLSQAQSHSYFLFARLKPSVTVDEAKGTVAVLGTRIAAAFPDKVFMRGNWGAVARELDGTRLAPVVRTALFVLLGAVSLVLLIACVNLANLLLGRAHARRREIAVRLALGAGRMRLVRLLVTESLLLSLVGGVASIIVAWGGARALAHVSPESALRTARGTGVGAVGFSSIQFDTTALLFTLGVAVAVGLAFGMVPALQATNPAISGTLKEGGAAAGAARGLRRFASRQFLVVTEVAVALVLLAGSGLMIRSLGNLLGIDPGFDPRHVLTLRLNVPGPAYVRDSMPGFYAELTGRLGALPGVTDVSLSDCPPLAGGCNGTRIVFPDRPPVPIAQSPGVGVHWVTPTWFETMRVPLRSGRTFNDGDRIGTQKVVLVSETAARQFWPNENPVGKPVGIGQGGFNNGVEVIGVVGDVRSRIDTLTKPDVYLSYAQSPTSRIMVFIRTPGEPLALVAAARRAIRELAPEFPVYDVQPMTARVADSMSRARFSAVLLSVFAGVALVLAVVGIYGVMSFTVAQRTREIGIRIALGADRNDVLRLVVGEGIALAGAGALLGLAGALAATRVLRSLLFSVDTWDPTTYAVILLLLGAAAVLATWMPARRATRVDPTEALRSD
jgi:putative ABC transport system permease protein